MYVLTLLHSERPKLYTILAFLCAIGLNPFLNTANTLNIRQIGLSKQCRSRSGSTLLAISSAPSGHMTVFYTKLFNLRTIAVTVLGVCFLELL